MKNYGKWITLTLAVIAVLFALFYPRGEEGEGMDITIPTTKRIPRNDYVTENFYWEEGFLRYKDRKHMIGIDVSVHQGVIDWQSMMQALKTIGYQGDLTFECDGFFKKLPAELYPDALRLLAHTGRSLLNEM